MAKYVGRLCPEIDLAGVINNEFYRGYSAYELAVKEGFDGTLEEWLASLHGQPVTHVWDGTTLIVTSASGTSSANLKGDKGDKGDRGERGLTGLQGIQGESGISARHKWNGTVLTITSASGSSSADLKGEKGDKGEDGIIGRDGKSAYDFAKDAGYTGTETEFSEKLAQETATPQYVDDAITEALKDLVGVEYYVCKSGEYDTTTYVPTLAGKAGVIYLVPKPVASNVAQTTTTESNNIYYEFIYNGSAFEKIGDTAIDLSDYLQEEDISTDANVDAMLVEIGIL